MTMRSNAKNLVAAFHLLTTASWAWPVFADSSHLALSSFGGSMQQLTCNVTNQRGVCMFASDCMKANGTHLGSCTDRFYLGSCCRLAYSDDAEPVSKSSAHVKPPNELPTALHPTGVRQPPTVPGVQYGPFLGSSEPELPSINGLGEPGLTPALGLQYVPFIAISELEQPSIHGIDVPYWTTPLFGYTFSSLWEAGSLSPLPTQPPVVFPATTLPGVPGLPIVTKVPSLWPSSTIIHPSPSLPTTHVPESTVVSPIIPSSTAIYVAITTTLAPAVGASTELSTKLSSPAKPESSQLPTDLSNPTPEVITVVNTESSLDLWTIAATQLPGSVDTSAVILDTENANVEVIKQPQIVPEITKVSQTLPSAVSSSTELPTTTPATELSTKVSMSSSTVLSEVSSTNANQQIITTEPIPSYPTKDAITNHSNVSATIGFPTEPATLAAQALPSFPNHEKVCGRPVLPRGKIVGGNAAQFGEWPWQVSLRHWQSSAFLHKCGAALLNENWAITAAHCVTDIQPEDLLLRLGEYDLASEDEAYLYVERKAQIVALHPQFDPWTFEYDLALLRFQDSVPYQPNILPVCIPTEDEANESFVGRMATVTGWGRLYEKGPLPSKLHQVNVPVINNTDCEAMYRKSGYTRLIQNTFLCAGYADGKKDACEGDSGGPVVLFNKDRWVLVGVISWGIVCAGTNQPGVYTRITEFRDWINHIIVF